MSESLRDPFQTFCKVSGAKNAKMTNKAFTKLVKDAGIVDKKTFTTTDTDIIWSRMAPKGTKEIDFAAFCSGLHDIVAVEYGKKHKMSAEEAHAKLVGLIENCTCTMHGVTGVSKTGNVDHFTDTSKYTGAHKERFGPDGKGRGIEGREDRDENTGYVGNYKGAGTYDKKAT